MRVSRSSQAVAARRCAVAGVVGVASIAIAFAHALTTRHHNTSVVLSTGVFFGR
jgi:hypothetical protein